jgi:hypothetical protein
MHKTINVQSDTGGFPFYCPNTGLIESLTYDWNIIKVINPINSVMSTDMAWFNGQSRKV